MPWLDRAILIIFLGSALVWLKMPNFLSRMRGRAARLEEMEEASAHPFVCPNCGGTFYVKWSRLHIVNGIKLMQLDVQGKVRMKCPHCNQVDWCRWTGKDEL